MLALDTLVSIFKKEEGGQDDGMSEQENFKSTCTVCALRPRKRTQGSYVK